MSILSGFSIINFTEILEIAFLDFAIQSIIQMIMLRDVR